MQTIKPNLGDPLIAFSSFVIEVWYGILGNICFYFGHPVNILPRTGGKRLKASGAYPKPFAKKVALAHKTQNVTGLTHFWIDGQCFEHTWFHNTFCRLVRMGSWLLNHDFISLTIVHPTPSLCDLEGEVAGMLRSVWPQLQAKQPAPFVPRLQWIEPSGVDYGL